MRPLYRAGQRDTCTVRSQPVCMKDVLFLTDLVGPYWHFRDLENYMIYSMILIWKLHDLE